jgi:S1-C subfamily serine protease
MRLFPNSLAIKIGGMIGVLLFFSGCGKENPLDKIQSEIYKVMEKVGPSVVSISATNLTNGEKKIGSGVVLEKNFILTTENLLQNSDELKIRLQDGKSIVDSEIVNIYCDFETNVSLIQVKKGNLKPVQLAKKEKIRNGTLGLMIGNTTYSKGLQIALGTVGSSWIGGVDPYDQELLVLSAPFSAYQSGTPIFNSEGELIGLAEGRLEGKEGIILILPASTCGTVGKILEKNGEVKRGWIGIFTEKRCARGKETFSKGGPGVLVTEIFKDGPALKEGIKVGDRIIEYEGKIVRNDLEFRKMISTSPIGSRVKLLLLRNGQKIEKQVIVESSKNMPVFRRCPNRSI